MIADGAAGGFEERCRGVDGDGLGALADFEVDVLTDLIADAEGDAGLFVRAETGFFGGERVGSGGEADEMVFASIVRCDLGFDAGGLFGGCDFGLRDGEAGGVLDCAEEFGVAGLGGYGAGGGQEKDEESTPVRNSRHCHFRITMLCLSDGLCFLAADEHR